MDPKMLEAIEQMKRGEEAGFNYIYSQTYKLVYFHARGYLKKEEDINDLVQNVYVAVFRSINKLENPEAFFCWLKMIVRNQAGMILRKFKDEVSLEEGMEEFQGVDSWSVTDISTLPEASAEQKAVGEILHELIEELPELQKSALMMQIYEGMKDREIAEVMGCSVNTVKSRLKYAKDRLREQVEEREKKDGIRLHAIGIPVLIGAFKLLSDKPVKAMAAETVYEEACSSVGLTTTGCEVLLEAVSKDVAAGNLATEAATKAAEAVTASAETAVTGGSQVAGAITELAGISRKAKILIMAGTLAVGGSSAAVGAAVGGEVIAEQKIEAFYEEQGYMEDLDKLSVLTGTEAGSATIAPTSTTTPTPTSTPTPTPYIMTEAELKTLENLVYEIRKEEAVILGQKEVDALTEIVIPAYIDGYPVTGIEKGAFYDCKTLKKVVFPENLREIGTEAFMWCESLEQIEVPDSVEYIGGSAFAWCQGVKSIVLSKNLRVIEGSTFAHCGTQTEIEIPEGVTALEAFSFGSTRIGQISLPESLVKIDGNVFGGSMVTFVDTVAGSYAEEWAIAAGYVSNQEETEGAPVFTYTLKDGKAVLTGMDKTSWNHLVLPSQIDGYTVTEIATGAFKDCDIKLIDIPAEVERIWADAFMTSNTPVGIRFHGSETKIDGLAFNLHSNSWGMESTAIIVPKDSEAEVWIGRITNKRYELFIY